MINVSMTDKNGVTLATAGKYCDQNVNVTPSADILRKDEQEKSATPSTSSQDITPDAGMALSKVTVNPITPAIVGGLDAKTFAAAAAAAIEGKGVTVPDGTLLDGMAALIGSIEAGVGDFSPFSIITWGTYVPAEDEKFFSIPNLTNGNNGFFVISRRDGSIGSNNVDSAFSSSMYSQMQRLRYSSGSYNNGYPTSKGSGVYSFGNYCLQAGVTYWYAYGGKS